MYYNVSFFVLEVVNLVEVVNICLWDGRKVSVNPELTFFELIKQYSPRLIEEALAVKANNAKKDLFDKPEDGDSLEIITYQSKEGKEIFFHSSSHIMAEAVQELFPGTRIAIGPAIEEGFYYDFDSEHTFSPEDFKIIEKKMNKIVKGNLAFQKKILKKERKSIEYLNISARGTWALIICLPFAPSSIPIILPLLLFKSPIISPI